MICGLQCYSHATGSRPEPPDTLPPATPPVLPLPLCSASASPHSLHTSPQTPPLQHALGLLRKEQLRTYQKILALIQPVITCWTCHFLSTRHLLETSGALHSCCIKEEKELEKCGGDQQQDKAKA